MRSPLDDPDVPAERLHPDLALAPVGAVAAHIAAQRLEPRRGLGTARNAHGDRSRHRLDVEVTGPGEPDLDLAASSLHLDAVDEVGRHRARAGDEIGFARLADLDTAAARLEPALPRALRDLERPRSGARVETFDVVDDHAPTADGHARIPEPTPELDAAGVRADDHVAALGAPDLDRPGLRLHLDRPVVLHLGAPRAGDDDVAALLARHAHVARTRCDPDDTSGRSVQGQLGRHRGMMPPCAASSEVTAVTRSRNFADGDGRAFGSADRGAAEVHEPHVAGQRAAERVEREADGEVVLPVGPRARAAVAIVP